MKKIVLLLLFPVLVFGQSKNQNYVKNKIYTQPSTSTIDTIVNITYHDGLGRPVQTVAYKSGGAGQDIIVPITYNSYTGSQTKQYLPYAVPLATGNTQDYRDNTAVIASQKVFYRNLYPQDVHSYFNPTTYSQVEIEPSPLGRVLQQAAPGDDWALNAGHTVRMGYDANSPTDKVYDFRIRFTDGNTEHPELYVYSGQKYYESGMLFKKTVKDENWIPEEGNNRTTVEFTDVQGRVVLKRQFNQGLQHDTYYVFDDYGNLTYVIPPLAADKIIKHNLVNFVGPLNFPWTKLVDVDGNLAAAYERKMEDYENENILNADLLSEYNGSGGFSLTADNTGNLTLNINVMTTSTMPYRNGIIADLSDLGTFSDRELGKLKGDRYEYYFLVENNHLKITGFGDVPSTIQSFTGDTMLEYKKKYSWAELVQGDETELSRYIAEIKKINEDEILTANIPNSYGGIGGASVTFGQDDTFNLTLNIQTPLSEVSFKDGAIFTLDVQRPIPDGDLGEVAGNGYSYRFSIINNMLVINGSGKFSSLVFNSTKAPSLLNTDAERLCYVYRYDKRNRVVEKHIPDNDWTYIVYDKLDRPVMTQDVNQRNTGAIKKWLFTKYDEFNRVAYTGEYVTTMPERGHMQNYVNTFAIFSERKNVTPFSFDGTQVYYTNDVFPQSLNDVEIFTINYYDDYTFDIKQTESGFSIYDEMPASGLYGDFTDKTKGLATGSVVRVLDMGNQAPGNNWITSFTRYDEKGRPKWAWSYNQFLDAWNSVDFNLDFTGKTIATRTKNKTGSNAVVTLWDFFTYDTMGRPLQHNQVTGSNENGSRELISWNSYDALGNVVQKKVGGELISGADYASHNALQDVDYNKNIRGWLKGINDINAGQNSADDLFSYGINYEGFYNGNISGTTWSTKVDNQTKGYSYRYDALNRLIDATYTNSSNADETYHEKGISYDKNGNIMHLDRWGAKEAGQFDMIDELTYIYKPMSNQLMEIDDNALSYGYQDINEVENDYDYDLAGNMQLDKNKYIRLIKYNYLNLPVSIGSDNGSIAYIYDATGAKIEKRVTNGSNITTVTYSYGFVYENDVLQYIPHEEGYIKQETNGDFSYVYQYKDHLGNVRLSYSDLDKDGVINDVSGFSDSFEADSIWNSYYSFGQLEIDNTKSHSGKSSGKISSPGPGERYSHSDVWLNIDNSQDTNYTYTVYAQSDGPTAEIFLFMKKPDEEGYFTQVDSQSQSVSSTCWTKIEKTFMVPAEIKRINIRLDVNSQGTIWFDDVSLKKTDGPSEIIDNKDYYPFGMEHGNNTVMSGGNAVAQKLGYNGQEYEQALGYNINEMDWRHFDPAIGRFNCIDKLAELDYSGSSYTFAFNNPVCWADPTGLFGTKQAAMNHISTYGLNHANVSYNEANGLWMISNGGTEFWEDGGDIRYGVINSAGEFTMGIVAGGGNVEGYSGIFGGNSKPTGVGQPGGLESLIPIWGSGRAAVDHFQNGNYWRGLGYTALAVSDVFFVKSIVTGIAKGGLAAFGKSYKYWSGTGWRNFYGKKGFAEKGQHLHHWLWRRNGQKTGTDLAWKMKNQMWNLMPMKSPAFHTAVHGKGINAFGTLERAYYGSPIWFQTGIISTVGHSLELNEIMEE